MTARDVTEYPDCMRNDGWKCCVMEVCSHKGCQRLSPSTYVTKDSGQREEFDTGSRRDTRVGKGRFDLLPWRAIRRLACVYERGAEKYGDRNWEKGQPQDRFFDSAVRHLADYAEGKRDEDHLAQAAWNIMAMIDQEERRESLPKELFE